MIEDMSREEAMRSEDVSALFGIADPVAASGGGSPVFFGTLTPTTTLSPWVSQRRHTGIDDFDLESLDESILF